MPTLEETFVDTDHAQLLVIPVARASVAMQVTTPLSLGNRSVTIPRITDDPDTDWVDEDEEIPESDMAADEVAITPKKVAGLTRVSNESVDDTNPQVTGLIGAGLTRDISRKIDAAFFGAAPAAGAKRPGGLEALGAGTTVAADPTMSIDPYVDAIAAADAAGATLRAFVTTPEVAKALAKIKQGTGSNLPLFGTGATNGIQRNVLGVPLLVSPYVLAGTVWGLPGANVYTAVRKNVTVDFDKSRWFEFDQTGIRAIMRVGFGAATTAGLIKIKAGA
ncbi:phage major capsid protein [Curtobacterium sp. MCPF17_002]|uniref:phage major capsid protein n=1 Tax=Curtobacterium sp. MCPF17_002 TaxID=2175645 RepID=UPI000DAA5E99|nr:phage major capsid protein [Curtobacterium sp. MCPF17_002]WIB76793.1 phage major capsid protein [Curtobacterium sp. MCPF17_002]